RNEQAVASADVRGPARLQRDTRAVLLRLRAVDRRALYALVRGNQRAVLVEDELLLVLFLLADEARRILALLEVRIVAVVRRDIARAHVHVAGQREPARDGVRAFDVEEEQLVPRLVGAREDRVAIDVEKLDWRCAVPDQIGVRIREARLQTRTSEPPREIAEKLRRLGR